MNYCPKCCFETRDMKFCPKCGFDLQRQEKRPDEEVFGEILEREAPEPEDLEREVPEPEAPEADPRVALIGKKPEHYIPIFDSMEKRGGSGWNWCGFFVAPMWFAYRKMYGWSAIAIIVPLVSAFVVGIIAASLSASDMAMNILSRVLSLLFAIIFGSLANSSYKSRIDKLVSELPEEEQARERFIKRKGGVSVLAVFLVLIIYLAFHGIILSMNAGAL